jgi:hypothetical protein
MPWVFSIRIVAPSSLEAEGVFFRPTGVAS